MSINKLNSFPKYLLPYNEIFFWIGFVFILISKGKILLLWDGQEISLGTGIILQNTYQKLKAVTLLKVPYSPYSYSTNFT